MPNLTAIVVRTLTKPGRHHDGDGLYLLISETGGKSWVFRYMRNGKAREKGLGPIKVVTLAAARDKARECHRTLYEGKDPLEATPVAVTFRKAADTFLAKHTAGLKNDKHAAQWRRTLETYAFPVFGDEAVASVDTGRVMRCLEPIWQDKPEQANRVRMRIEKVLDAAKVRGWRTGDNPARWKGHLDHLLTKRPKAEHQPALPWKDAAAFMTGLRQQGGTAARALEFAILTAVRSGEARGAVWSEIDLDEAVWSIPAERMKMKREHRVPLSGAAVAILRQLSQGEPDSFIFPGDKPDKPLSDMALLTVLRRMNPPKKDQARWRDGATGERITVHGFRSTFRDWAEENTEGQGTVAEAALAHGVGDKTEAAYRRGDLFEKRRALMERWAEWCITSHALPTIS